jgi:uncharacterized protein with HEPN domain
MTLTDKETESLKRILTRELTMIGGEREAAKQILEKLERAYDIVPNKYEQKVFDTVAAHFRTTTYAIRSRVQKQPLPIARAVVAYYLLHSGKSRQHVRALIGVAAASLCYYIEQFDYPHVKAAINEIGRIEK